MAVDAFEELGGGVLQFQRRAAGRPQEQGPAAPGAAREIDPHRLAAGRETAADQPRPVGEDGGLGEAPAARGGGQERPEEGRETAHPAPPLFPSPGSFAYGGAGRPRHDGSLMRSTTIMQAAVGVQSPPAGLPAGTRAALTAGLLAWYRESARALPWRVGEGVVPDPWRVLVSEFMLQQTTVATVKERFADFLARFPDAASLAAADLDEVLHAWQGLGYYRRARLLHACAREIRDRHGGVPPADRERLRALPGIGPYTAAAVAAIAFGEPVVPVDANVARVLARLFAVEAPRARATAEIRRLAAGLGDHRAPAAVAQAWMELGALVCRPRRPRCGSCPLATFCLARRRGIETRIPVAGSGRRPRRHGFAFLMRRADGRILLRRRPVEGLLGGTMDLPGSSWTAAPPDGPPPFPRPGRWRPLPGRVRHPFTHFTLELAVWQGEVEAEPGEPGWYDREAMAGLALSSLTRKLLRHAGVEPPPAVRGARRR